jgi:hypothetical protein
MQREGAPLDQSDVPCPACHDAAQRRRIGKTSATPVALFELDDRERSDLMFSLRSRSPVKRK